MKQSNLHEEFRQLLLELYPDKQFTVSVYPWKWWAQPWFLVGIPLIGMLCVFVLTFAVSANAILALPFPIILGMLGGGFLPDSVDISIRKGYPYSESEAELIVDFRDRFDRVGSLKYFCISKALKEIDRELRKQERRDNKTRRIKSKQNERALITKEVVRAAREEYIKRKERSIRELVDRGVADKEVSEYE